jgi:hypothetical protein
MSDIIGRLGAESRVRKEIMMLCPYLHCDAVDAWHGMTACGAYLDQTALGGSRLHEIGETEGHPHCEYYLDLRSGS